MSKKILAIGGGNIGECTNGITMPYETEIFDREIINLSNSLHPNILFVGLADISNMDKYFYYFESVFKKKYNCNCKMIHPSDLPNQQSVHDIFDWADVVYVGGGNVFSLMNICKKYKLQDQFISAYNDGKVMCGNSAGAICWFKYGNTVNPNNRQILIKQECFGLKNMVLAPHCDEINGHFENVENLITGDNIVGVSLSNCCGLEIVDDKFRLIGTEFERYKISPFGIRSFWFNDRYTMEDASLEDKYRDLNQFLTPVPLYNNQVRDDVKQLLKHRNIYFK